MINLFEEKADLLENEMNDEVEAVAIAEESVIVDVIVGIAYIAIIIVCW